MNFSFQWSVFLALSLALSARAETSDLWGARGERWDPRGRLPDFSFAGYHCGEKSPPRVRRGVNVKTFGAKGDGVTDDSAAFLKALATVENGAIEVPAGRYVITDILEIKRPGIVLRGAGPGKTVLYFPKPLQDIRPEWSRTTTGQRTSNYSWSGGFIWLKGDFRQTNLANVVAEARRGDTTLRISDPTRLRAGQRIEIFLTDTGTNSLAAELYSGDPGDTGSLRGNTRASLVCRIIHLTGDRITFDRPLRFDVKPEWQPRIRSFAPTVVESAVENLTLEFPPGPYAGHFTEMGFNAVAFSQVADCWARNLRIVNADSGLFPGGNFCTLQNVVFESVRPPNTNHWSGHHGIYFEGDDNLLTGFDFRTRFVHDLTASECGGNVIADGRGVDLCFDLHRDAPYEILFVNLDAGAGTRLWHHGGGRNRGKAGGARTTFWNIRAAQPQRYPPDDFGPWSINLVAVRTDQPSLKNATNRWFEAISPARITPRDIHAAQLERRLKAK